MNQLKILTHPYLCERDEYPLPFKSIEQLIINLLFRFKLPKMIQPMHNFLEAFRGLDEIVDFEEAPTLQLYNSMAEKINESGTVSNIDMVHIMQNLHIMKYKIATYNQDTDWDPCHESYLHFSNRTLPRPHLHYQIYLDASFKQAVINWFRNAK